MRTRVTHTRFVRLLARVERGKGGLPALGLVPYTANPFPPSPTKARLRLIV